MKFKIGFSIQEYLHDVGIPKRIHTYVAKEMNLVHVSEYVGKAGIKTSTSETYSL